jgi:hypothetical protein
MGHDPGHHHAHGSRAKLRTGVACLAALGFVLSAEETAQAHDEKTEGAEHLIIVGVGGAAELELGDGTVHRGANVMIEWDAIEDWLEFEVGASLFSAEGGIEVPIDLLVKKPFKLARWADFMIGVGPEVVQVTGMSEGTYFGGEVALDFMFSPRGRRVGLWIEPEYDLIFHNGASNGLGSTGGLLFGW